MSGSEAKCNLLSGTMDWSGGWVHAGQWKKAGTHDGFVVMRKEYPWNGLYKRVVLTAGTTYTFSAMVRVPAGKQAHIYTSSGNTVNDTDLADSEFAGGRTTSWITGDGGWFEIHLTFTPTASKAVWARIESDDSYAIEVCALMLVEGTEPAAWAPAEGETLAGVGSLMSANLWDASAVNFKPDADGVYICGTSTGELNCSIAGASALSANQTVHFGASLRGAGKGYLSPFVEYRNAVGNLNWVGFPHWTPTDQWQRFEATCVVPSGMTITKIGFNTSGATGDIEVMNPAWSYGSPVCLASSAHTPYATQDHISATYATKASLKVTDDSVKAEVSARAQTDQNVADLSSRLTQTANSLTSEVTQRTKTDQMVSDLSSRLTQTASGLSVSIDRLSDTDKKVNSWFGFGSDSSGNPQLTMGSSSSPVVGVYTNTGLAYRSRSGATLLELDGASRSSTMPHVHADDVSIGSWQWVPTQNGTHFTLQWIGG